MRSPSKRRCVQVAAIPLCALWLLTLVVAETAAGQAGGGSSGF